MQASLHNASKRLALHKRFDTVVPNKYLINYTQTFMPGRFLDIDTIWDGPKVLLTYLSRNKEFVEHRFVIEKHPDKPSRKHVHGQIIIDCGNNPDKRFAVLTRLQTYCRKMYGINHWKFNQISQFEEDENKQYPSYWAYCMKEVDCWFHVTKNGQIDEFDKVIEYDVRQL